MNNAAEPPNEPSSFEYPDEAGYPDGMGTLDEGTAEGAVRAPSAAGEGEEETDQGEPTQDEPDQAEPDPADAGEGDS
jgi:hypothetical protein